VGQEVEGKKGRYDGSTDVDRQDHFPLTPGGRAKAQTIKGNHFHILGLVIDADPANGNVDHAPHDAQKQQGEKLLRREAEAVKSQRKKAILDQTEEKEQKEEANEQKH
jgi:hypothetical protein